MQRDTASLIAEHGSIRKAASALGLNESSIRRQFHRQTAHNFDPSMPEYERKSAAIKAAKGTVSLERYKKLSEKAPRKGQTKRYILSSAQDGRPVHSQFLKNIEAYADHIDARIIIAPYAYCMGGSGGSYDSSIVKYLSWDQHTFSGRIMFAANIRTNPTSPHPLSGLETYTGHMWGVFPHPRVALRSIATHFGSPAKQIMTTGTITRPKYRAEKTGTKAMFHSVIGAVIVEIDGVGNLFCRHLLADAKGNFQDLDRAVVGGKVRKGSSPVSAIVWGDVHVESIDEQVMAASWGRGGMLDTLRPKHQIIHDLADLGARSHHSRQDPHHRFKVHVEGRERVADAIAEAGRFLEQIRRPWCMTTIAESNHDHFLLRWLRESCYRFDPINAIEFLELQLATYRAIESRDDRFSIFEHAVRRSMKVKTGRRQERFLRETDSFRVGGIEFSLHGHKGANGSKGSMASFVRGGTKSVVAHTHSPSIHDGVYMVGTSSKLDMGYNRGGLSSWAHTHCVVHRSGKRQLVTISNGKWRA